MRRIPLWIAVAVVGQGLAALCPALGATGDFGMQIISTAMVDPACVFATDLDGDGDADVLSASHLDNKIAWYENTDGLGTFGPQQVISTAAYGASSVFATDLNGDGDADVLSASENDNKIAWYESTNGLGSFGPQQVICSVAEGARSVCAADLDGDGDEDVLSASSRDNSVYWYENTNSLGAFAPREWISCSEESPVWVTAADLDSDGDPDVLSASGGDDVVAWYENRMSGYFVQYGTGYAGTGGVLPTLSGTGRPSPGQSILVEVGSGQPNALCLFMIGYSEASVVLPSGAVILVGNLIGGTGYLLALDGTGNLSIPATFGPSAAGTLFMQALLEDAGSGNGRYSATNGLKMSIQ